MSLLQDVLRPTNPRDVDAISSRLNKLSVPDDSPASSRVTSPTPRNGAGDDSSDEDELIGVVSLPGTPRRLQSRTTSRSTSPSRAGFGASSRRAPGPLHLAAPTALSTSSTMPRSSSVKPKNKTDPLRVLTTDLNQRIFRMLDVKDLASCSRVCVKWERSQSLNYLWFLHSRKLEFGDESLPKGKWTRRESKDNWRKSYMRTARTLRDSEYNSTSRYGYSSAPSSMPGSGYSTPRSVREEKWAAEANEGSVSKNDLRDMYKDLGGRKARGKAKVGVVGSGGARDRGGWDGGEGF